MRKSWTEDAGPARRASRLASERLSVTRGDVTVIHDPDAGSGEAPPEHPSGRNLPQGLYRSIQRGLVVSDVFALTAALFLSYLLRFGAAGMPLEYIVLTTVGPFLWVATFAASGLYAVGHLSGPEEYRRTIAASSLGIVLIVVGSYWSHSEFSRLWVGLTWMFTLVFELAARRFWRWYQGKLRADGRLALRTLIVGANSEAVRLAGVLLGQASGFAPVGYVRSRGRDVTANTLPVLGSISHLHDLIERHSADCLFVASTGVSPEEMVEVARTARREGVEVRVSANLPQILTSRLAVQQVGDVMALSLRPVRLSRGQSALKRSFDLVTTLLLLLITLPAWAAIAVLTRVTSRGPVLYRQQRVGRRGRRFTMYKFRTMVRDAEAMRALLLEQNEATGPLFKIRDDPRVTPLGRWLRRWSLDELPQLLNVLKGDMSLVGPRPPLPEEVGMYDEWHLERLEVPPGLTGLWQVSGRSNLPFDEYVRLDLFYIENWSLAYDLYIMAKTVPVVLSRRGSY